ncbi:MAG: 3-methyl-2-oxobutanoate hydroxymethyltransferase [Armatimonadota bacterium]|nr:3-methyl-2-oxobutanoate hydroxymethyltransferase [bacterium]
MENKKVTAPGLAGMKSCGEKISVLTAYDYPMGRIVDDAGIDIALVGDSVGRVVLGYDSELKVTMEDMISHSAAVSRGVRRALLVCDMPFLSYQISEDDAVRNAGRLVQEGNAEVVKLEGGEYVANTIHRIVSAGIPVIGHLGLTPQSVHQLGGFRKVGKDPEGADKIKKDALILQDAGASGIVLEAIPAALAKEVTDSLSIPTIGIGSGPDCDGQVIVTHDLLGLFDKFKPSFVKQYADVWQVMLKAFENYSRDVKDGAFPERK